MLPSLLAQSIIALLSGAVIVEDDAVGRPVVGQHTPGGTGVQDLEDGVDDFPARELMGRPPGLGGGGRGSRSCHSVSVMSVG